MFALALGVRTISETLPDPVYALLSGLNASTVGIVAVAAVQLAEKCIQDPLSRILVIFGACAGLCYSALWYFPVLITIGGAITIIWDLWLARKVRLIKQNREARKRRAADQAAVAENSNTYELVEDLAQTRSQPAPSSTAQTSTNMTQRKPEAENLSGSGPVNTTQRESVVPDADRDKAYNISIRTGSLVLGAFVATFIAVQVSRSQLDKDYRVFSVFANMYLAGTIIFGGGPVVIPLLREYVVTPGWVQPRDFLIGKHVV